METINSEQIAEAVKIVLAALDMRYEVWRREAIQRKSDFQTFEVMDRMHRTVKRYIQNILGLDDASH